MKKCYNVCDIQCVMQLCTIHTGQAYYQVNENLQERNIKNQTFSEVSWETSSVQKYHLFSSLIEIHIVKKNVKICFRIDACVRIPSKTGVFELQLDHTTIKLNCTLVNRKLVFTIQI